LLRKNREYRTQNTEIRIIRKFFIFISADNANKGVMSDFVENLRKFFDKKALFG